ncbi:MAG: hypothetical protein UX89_C0013G0002 [Parcubacteria group bacterium GW2011_GWA2_47_16]|nr:MAG: hypothetical protein UX89_C0013G0002 [Parcubacteria group bacterium GW2011_GWA2_47_16]
MDNIEHKSGSEFSAAASRVERPSTIETILGGGAKIKFLSESMEERDIIGKGKFKGNTYSYELEVPHLTRPGEKWVTELAVWFPAAHYPLFDERAERKPEMQIDILTGQGNMTLTKNPETMRKIYEEIRRQTDQRLEINPEG